MLLLLLAFDYNRANEELASRARKSNARTIVKRRAQQKISWNGAVCRRQSRGDLSYARTRVRVRARAQAENAAPFVVVVRRLERKRANERVRARRVRAHTRRGVRALERPHETVRARTRVKNLDARVYERASARTTDNVAIIVKTNSHHRCRRRQSRELCTSPKSATIDELKLSNSVGHQAIAVAMAEERNSSS